MFVRVAKSWLRFHGQLATGPPNPFQHLGEEFAEAKRLQGRSVLVQPEMEKERSPLV